MIELTKLNHEKFYMNCDLIEIIEQMPDTLITMTNGKKHYALESADEVIAKIAEYKKSLFTNCAILNQYKANASDSKKEAADIEE